MNRRLPEKAAKKNRTRLILSSPKTESSRRKIPIADKLRSYLEKYKNAPETYLLTGTKVFMEPRTFYGKYRRFLQECGLGPYNYHALRHTFATRCVECGADIKSLSEILGHSDVSVTLSRYVHPSMEQKKNTIERMFRSMEQTEYIQTHLENGFQKDIKEGSVVPHAADETAGD